jgi:(2R)-ethylmalonyl-CoA mutase
MNTSMTINATAAWLLGLYVANAEKQGISSTSLRGTTQNDIVKEYLSRGTYIFPPEASRRLIVDMIAFCSEHIPSWNPINICSYHLQEAGATPVQEIAYSLANAVDILDAVRDSGQVPEDRFEQVVGSLSFFVNSGIRFVEEVCKMRAFTSMWDQICQDRYGVKDPKMRRFRYGVQVNSLGLTEAQPENNVQRIVLEALGVTLSKGARARSLQLPAWNEALGLPKPWDQQWSLRMQQVLAHETDLLEYEDIFDGSKVVEGLTSKLISEAQIELDDVMSLGGAFVAINELKGRLVASHTERMRKIEEGALTVVGVNQFIESAESPLTSEESILRVDPAVETEIRADLTDWKLKRDDKEVEAALSELRLAASSDTNIMLPTIAAAKVGVTTGEWSQVLRDVFGEYRAPTGVSSARRGSSTLADVAQLISGLQQGPPRLLVAKPGLDGHSNGAEQIAVAARDAGMEVIYDGIRVTPEHIAATARDEDVDIIGLSILSGSHLHLIPEVLEALREQGVTAPVVVGGIIPVEDQEALVKAGVSRIYTPKDYELAQIMNDIAQLVIKAREISA